MLLDSMTKAESTDAPAVKVPGILADARNWPQWASVDVKSLCRPRHFIREFFKQRIALVDIELGQLKNLDGESLKDGVAIEDKSAAGRAEF